MAKGIADSVDRQILEEYGIFKEKTEAEKIMDTINYLNYMDFIQ